MENSGQYGQNINAFQSQPMMAPNAMPINTNSDKKSFSKIILIVGLIFTSILSIIFICLFVNMYAQWDEAKTDVEGQVEQAVASSELALRTKLEDEFAEKEKYPYRTFGGPADLGSLSFEFPKTWSVYVPESSSTSEYRAYLNPGYVGNVSTQTVMALRVSILNRAADSVKEEYARRVSNGDLSYSTKVINGVTADIYRGVYDASTGYNTIICLIKIRDKTVILQTDALIFEADFNRILETIKYNA